MGQIVKWIIEGQSVHDIRESIETAWPDKNAQPLMVAAAREIEKAADVEPALVRGFAIEATRTIFQKAMEIGDLATALRAVKQLTDLAGK